MNATSTSTTQLRQMLTELSKAGGETAGIFESMAGKTFKEFIAEGNNLNDALKLMEEYAKANNVEINDLFGSVQAGSAALMLTGDSTEMFVENLENMSSASGATQEAFETMDNGIGRSFEKIKVAMSDMLLELGTNLSPVVASATDYILDAMPTIQAVIETTFKAIGEIIGVFVEIIDWLVENLRQFYEDNEEIFNDVFETIREVFDLITEAVQGFIEIFQTLWNKYGEYITNVTDTIWKTISGLFKNALGVIEGILDVAIGLFTGDWDRFGEGLKKITSNIWEAIKGLFSGGLDLVKNIMTGSISILTGVAKSIMEGIWNGFKEIWNSITSWVSNVFDGLIRTITGFAGRFYDAGRDMFSSVWDGMKGIWSSLSNWVSDKISWLSDKLMFWRRSEREMSQDPTPSSRPSPNIPQYAVGTPFVPSDGLAYLHKGEAVIPARYNPFTNNNNLGGNTVHINQGDINIDVKGNVDKNTMPDLKRMAENAVDESLRRLRVELNKSGVFRGLSTLSTGATQWARRR